MQVAARKPIVSLEKLHICTSQVNNLLKQTLCCVQMWPLRRIYDESH